MLKKIATLCSLALLGTAIVARAGTITDMGSVYTLTYSSAGTNLYDVFLKIDTSGYTGSLSDRLNDVALKIVSQNSDFITNPYLISGPAGYSTTTMAGGLSNSGSGGCNGSGGGFFCDQYTGGGNGVVVGPGHVYTFEWAVNTTMADLFTGINEASVKALYLSCSGCNAGITSRNITLDPSTPPPVPEPSSLLLMGSGILGAAGMMRRRILSALKG